MPDDARRMTLAERLRIAEEVADALRSGRPVVALESSLVTHGLPQPANLEVARAAEAAVRGAGAVPATVAVHRGRLLIGLADAQLQALASESADDVMKASRPSLAAALARDSWAGTTVSATMLAAHAAGIRVFATGGIGGVHRATGTGGSFDVSSDLEELARTPIAVVCAGPKSILDVPATLEVLETRGVPVVSLGSADVAGFFAVSAGVRAPIVAADEAELAALVAAHLELGLGSAILVSVPVPGAAALPADASRAATDQAIRDAKAAGVHGPPLTPWILGRVAELTDGASIRANRALIVNDARVAANLAKALASAR